MAKNTIKLELALDVDQVTKALDYHFIDEEGENIFRHDGRCAGTFHFPVGAKIEVEVVALSDAKDDARISITDFTITSISTLPPGKSDLSMFDKNNACATIDNWGLATSKKKNDRATTRIKSLQNLAIRSDDGQWSLSGFLSVLIEKAGDKKPTARLFFFDPESTTGSGGDVLV